MLSAVFVSLIFLISNCFHPHHGMENKETDFQAGRAYYISPTGNDRNPGTREAAFQSMGRLNEIHFNPDDSIFFEGGRHFSGNLSIHTQSPGEPQHVFLIDSYGSGRAVLEAGNKSAVLIENTQWLLIKNLTLKGSGRKKGNSQSGVLILNSRNITADSLEITGFQKSGLRIDYSKNITIKNIIARENGFAGISVGGSAISKKTNHNIYIGYCRAENNPGDPSNLKNHSGNGIVVSSCTHVVIEYCTATNNGWDMPRKGNGPVGIWAFEADSVMIQHCLSYRNKTSVGGADGGGFDLDGGVTNSVVQYCLSYENQGAGYCLFQYLYASPWHNNIFRFNISENDGAVSDAHGGIYIWNSSSDRDQFYNGWVYNNTIYNTKGSAVVYSELSKRKGFGFYNNIFITRHDLVRGKTGQDIYRGNDWWNMDHMLTPGNGNGLESVGDRGKGDWGKFKILNTNPHFIKAGKTGLTSASGLRQFDHYALSINSPLRNSGLDLRTEYGINIGDFDFNGKEPPVTGIGASF
jgi:hypothetical protein